MFVWGVGGGGRFETVKYNIYEGHEKGLKRGSRWNFLKRKNSRNVEEKYCEKLGNFQVGLT